jgi:hypothetical protein
MPTRPFGMGRLYFLDERDEGYPLSAVLQQTDRRRRMWWDEGWWGNQGADPYCVAFSWAHFLADGPRPASIFSFRRPGVDTRVLYCEAQKNDPWPGDCATPLYDGSTVRAGAKVLKDWGLISEYRWANGANEVAQAVLTQGPVVVGTMWYEDMFNADRTGLITATGRAVGGHAYVLNGVDLDTGLFRIKNSWGPTWGLRGRGYISISHMDRLLNNFGEACVAMQKKGR